MPQTVTYSRRIISNLSPQIKASPREWENEPCHKIYYWWQKIMDRSQRVCFLATSTSVRIRRVVKMAEFPSKPCIFPLFIIPFITNEIMIFWNINSSNKNCSIINLFQLFFFVSWNVRWNFWIETVALSFLIKYFCWETSKRKIVFPAVSGWAR